MGLAKHSLPAAARSRTPWRASFAGCIVGIHEVLRRQGLLAGMWCLDPRQRLRAGQRREIDRVIAAYPHLTDDAFVTAHRAEWVRG